MNSPPRLTPFDEAEPCEEDAIPLLGSRPLQRDGPTSSHFGPSGRIHGQVSNRVRRARMIRDEAKVLLTKTLEDLSHLIQSESPKAVACDLECALAIVKDRYDELRTKNEELVAIIEDDREACAEYRDSQMLRDQVVSLITLAKRTLSVNVGPGAPLSMNDAIHVVPGNAESSVVRAKLPDLQLPTFEGDLHQFPSFWDQFEATVDSVSNLSDVIKFSYLRSALKGKAMDCIAGLTLRGSNYKVAVDTLKSMYDRPDILRQACWSCLYGLPPAKSMDPEELRSLYNKIEINLRTLESTKQFNPNDIAVVEFLPLFVIGKFPSPIVEAWQRRQNPTSQITLAEVRNFLRTEIEARETARSIRFTGTFVQTHCPTGRDPAIPTGSRSTRKPATSDVLFSSDRNRGNQALSSGVRKPSLQCSCCKKTPWHRLLDCHVFREMSPTLRTSFVRETGRCFNCFGSTHRSRLCQSRRRCQKCGKAHHTLLHFEEASTSSLPDRLQTKQESRPTPPLCSIPPSHSCPSVSSTSFPNPRARDFPPCEERATNNHQCLNTSRDRCGILQTALVRVQLEGEEVLMRVLIDGAAERSHVRAGVARNFPVLEKKEFVTYGFGGTELPRSVSTLHEIVMLSRHDSKPHHLRFWSSPKLCESLPSPHERSFPNELYTLPLADVMDGKTKEIDFIIGQDQYYEVMFPEIVRGQSNMVAQNSVFGWVIGGAWDTQPVANNRINVTRTYLIRDIDSFWGLESIGISMSEVEENMDALPTPVFDTKEGRYVMALPWQDDSRPKSNYRQAETRLHRLVSSPKFDEIEYDRSIQRLVADRIVECVRPSKAKYYLPHHGIRREGKPVRVVFDGSVGINSYLKTGPNLLHKIVDVLLKVRASPHLVQGDVMAAFHQVLVHQQDVPYLSFLWNGYTYAFRRVPFGLTCSP